MRLTKTVKYVTIFENKNTEEGAVNAKEIHETIIVGGGASGMLCAVALARAGCGRVLLLERNERLGRKLSATGNGQGNVTNEDLSVSHYFSDDLSAVSSVLSAFGREELLSFLRLSGGLFSADERGRVYPSSRQASSVTDILRFELARRGVGVRTGVRVRAVKKTDGIFEAETDSGIFCGKRLVLACGGKAAPHLGTEGDGYLFARSFGHTVTTLRPSLVQLRTEKKEIRGLKGVRSCCALTLKRGDKKLCAFSGDVLFTDYGVSGDAVFRASAFAEAGDILYIDFLPEFSEKEVADLLYSKNAAQSDTGAEDLLRCVVNSAIGRAILRAAGISPAVSGADLRKAIPRIVRGCKRTALAVTGSAGFDSAQVTKGGVPLSELNSELMSKKVRGLYLAGELVNVDGECGGYNLQWAFSSGAVIARAVAKEAGACASTI